MPDKDKAEALASLERLNSDTIDWSETRNSWRRLDLRSRWHKQTNVKRMAPARYATVGRR